MIRLIVKLAIAALLANAVWRIGSSYMTFYKFKDAVTEAAQFARARNDDQLRSRVLELAQQYDVPLAENGFTVKRQDEHTIVDGSYDQMIEALPGYRRPWTFPFHVDVIVYERFETPR